jgi:hypothetical protein
VWAIEAARLGARSGRDTSHAVSAVRARLSIAVASTGATLCCPAAQPHPRPRHVWGVRGLQ